MLDSGVSHDLNDIRRFRFISPEARCPSLLWKELGTKTTKSTSSGVTGVFLEAARTLCMLSADFDTQSEL